jgi:hypothetical protein
MATMVGLAACGGGGADTGPGGSADGGPQFAWELKFTKCLRAEGVEIDDPDPVKGAPSVEHDDTYRAASKTCQGKIGDPPSAAKKPGQAEAIFKNMLKTARCMRGKGVDMPDPQRDQALQIPEGTSEDVLAACLPTDGK